MSDDKPNENLILSDTPVSMPVVVPSLEDADMNGFAFSKEFGLLVSMNRSDDRKDLLAKLRGWSW